MTNINLIAITPTHPLWPQWVALYDASFPDYERVPLADISDGLDLPNPAWFALAFTESEHDPILLGMSYLQIREEERIAYLVYLAVNTNLRNRGLGVQIYEAIKQFAIEHGSRNLFFEVEHPEDPHVDAEMASRRISWYLRHGAELISGIELRQRVKQPYIEYFIVAHRLVDNDESCVIAEALSLFPDARQTAAPVLNSQWPPV